MAQQQNGAVPMEGMSTKQLMEYARTLEEKLRTTQLEVDNLKEAAQENVVITPYHPERYIGLDKEGNAVFEYLIDLPPHAGEGLRINGHMLYHGQTYTLTKPNLLSVKDNVQRAWDHEKSLHDDNENIYRPMTERVLKGNDRRGRRL